MLKCIKSSINPASCKLKNPLSYKSSRSYQIIHKAEKQLLYEHIRNINGILATLDKKREDQYKMFKAIISNTDNQDQDQDLDRSRLFINKIKEHRHDKIKAKHMKKFEKLHFKHYEYHHNINRCTHFFDNTDHVPDTLSRQPNVPSSFTTSSTAASTTSSATATPITPTPSTQAVAILPAPRLSPSTSTSHTGSSHMDKWVNNLSKTPSLQNSYPSYKKVPTLPSLPNTPIEAYITTTEQASSKLPAQEADEFRSDVNRLLKQIQQQHNNHCNLNPSQCRALTELKMDNTRVVLTADKGVAMAIMDQEDYTNKAQALLQDTNTYKVLPKDPTPQLKNKLITLLKDIKQTGGLTTQNTNNSTPLVQSHTNFMAWPKYTKQVPPSDPLFPVGGPSHMVWPRSYHISSNHL